MTQVIEDEIKDINSASYRVDSEQNTIKLSLDLAHPGCSISPLLYGLMTEEINHAYEGGLYAELIRNRSFKDDADTPHHWSPVTAGAAAGSIELSKSVILNNQNNVSLRLSAFRASESAPFGVANEGYWGIPVRPRTHYRVSFYAKASKDYAGSITAKIESTDGHTEWAVGSVATLSPEWRKYTIDLETGDHAVTSLTNRFLLTMDAPGNIWLTLVSLFPPTYRNRENGLRPDIMELLAAMKPAFLRFPGGNFLEGLTFEERYEWKKTIGDISERPGHPCPWGYRSTDGLGLMEFLTWCEDLGMEPVLGVFAGYTLNGAYVTGPELEPFIQEALDQIEYITGPATSPWGARRANDGHPDPFTLRYVEIGNEDWFDKSGSYEERFAQFFDAIRAKYPAVRLIASAPVKSRGPDILDDHYYRVDKDMMAAVDQYQDWPSSEPRIMVGEWATTNVIPWSEQGRNNPDTPDLAEAISDAAWMLGLERASDAVVMQCYAPLFINVNKGARQWAPNLIGYDALTSFGSPSYYAQCLFGANRGDVIIPVNVDSEVISPLLHLLASLEFSTGDMIVKIVNASAEKQRVEIAIDGASGVRSNASHLLLAGNPCDRNSIDEPRKIAPLTRTVDYVEGAIICELPAHSINVLRICTV